MQGFRGKGYAPNSITNLEWDAMISVNSTRVKNSLAAVLRHIRDGRSIVSVSSIAE
jgi:NADP-dependent 3-hydroxy acid dehydrogenase YdfG